MVTAHWSCDICHRSFNQKTDAEACENRGIPTDILPIGYVYGDHRKGSFYEKITFAIKGHIIDKHFVLYTAWACRDNQYGDSTERSQCEGRTEGPIHLDHDAPHFKRMIAWLESQGIKPIIPENTK